MRTNKKGLNFYLIKSIHMRIADLHLCALDFDLGLDPPAFSFFFNLNFGLFFDLHFLIFLSLHLFHYGGSLALGGRGTESNAASEDTCIYKWNKNAIFQ